MPEKQRRSQCDWNGGKGQSRSEAKVKVGPLEANVGTLAKENLEQRSDMICS